MDRTWHLGNERFLVCGEAPSAERVGIPSHMLGRLRGDVCQRCEHASDRTAWRLEFVRRERERQRERERISDR